MLKALKLASLLTDPAFGWRRRGPRILIYHQVGAESGLEMDVTIDDFEWQLDWMIRNGNIVDLETALARVGDPGSESMYVLTFDDGHRSLFHNAFPLMHERGLPFTLYVTTAPLESDRLLHGHTEMRLSSWEDIQRMHETGLMTIGAHGHRHLDARAHSRSVLEQDFERCNVLLRERLDIEPRHFAYPWGHRSRAAESLVRVLYQTAVVGSGPEFNATTDRHRIPRIPVMHSDGWSLLFARKMWGGFRLEVTLRSIRDLMRGS